PISSMPFTRLALYTARGIVRVLLLKSRVRFRPGGIDCLTKLTHGLVPIRARPSPRTARCVIQRATKRRIALRLRGAFDLHTKIRKATQSNTMEVGSRRMGF